MIIKQSDDEERNTLRVVEIIQHCRRVCSSSKSKTLHSNFIFCVLFQRPVSVEVSDPLLARQVCCSIPNWINLSNHCTHFKLAYLLAAACCKKSFHNTKKVPSLHCQFITRSMSRNHFWLKIKAIMLKTFQSVFPYLNMFLCCTFSTLTYQQVSAHEQVIISVVPN